MAKSNIKFPKPLLHALLLQHPRITVAAAEPFGGIGRVLESADVKPSDVLAVIDAVQDATMGRWGHKAWTTQAIALSWMELTGDVEEAARALDKFLAPNFVAEGKRPWKGTAFYTMDRKTLKTLDEHRAEIRAALRKAAKRLAEEAENSDERTDDDERTIEERIADIIRTDDDVPTPEAEPTPEAIVEVKPPKNSDTMVRQLVEWVEAVQDWQEAQELEQWGYRQVKNGRALLSVGFPLAAIKDAYTIDWDPEARRHHGVKEFDLMAWGRKTATADETALEAIIRTVASAGVNVATVGGRGIGKTTTIERMAERDGVRLCVVSCNPDTAGAEFFGVLTPGLNDGYVLSEFSTALLAAEKGERVRILLDEMDAMDSATALMLNRALEQRRISHRFLGRTIDFGANVEFYGAMNTTGQGATDEFVGRDRQDSAFLDRFLRIRVKLDRKLQREIAGIA